MNELLPYEEELNQQWANIPLPNEDMAWEDMKRRLKKDDDDKVLLPFWLRGCAVWGLLFILLAGLGWGTYTYVKTKKKNTTTNTFKEDMSNTTSKNDTIINEEKANNTNSSISSTPVDISKNENNEVGNNKYKFTEKASAKIKITAIQASTDIENSKPNLGKLEKGSLTYSKSKIKKKAVKNKKISEDERFDDNDTLITSKGKSKINITPSTAEDEVVNNLPDTVGEKDSTLKKNSDTLVKKDNKQADTSKKEISEKDKKKNKFTFIVGIGEQQIVPINEQKLTPYNSLGRKGTLLDYIPSVYMRLKRNEKWFLQAEFKYGAPQYNKNNFLYQQKIVPDTGVNPPFTNITSYKLKKTYYHQLPITFNYYIAPNWSLGAGIQINKFFGALAEVDVNRKNNFTQTDSTISSFITIDKKDSSNLFKKNYYLGILESQYQWKRWTFGAKYIFGLQPYITFTLPGNLKQKEKSNSVLLFIKYELWNSKKKTKK